MGSTAQASAAPRLAGGTDSRELERIIARLEEAAAAAEVHTKRLGGVVTRLGTPYTYPSSEEVKEDGQHPGALQRLYALLDRIGTAQIGTDRELSAIEAFV